MKKEYPIWLQAIINGLIAFLTALTAASCAEMCI